MVRCNDELPHTTNHEDWAGKPIEIINVNQDGHQGTDRLNVIIELEREDADALLGYEVDETEWLDEED